MSGQRTRPQDQRRQDATKHAGSGRREEKGKERASFLLDRSGCMANID